MVRHFVGETCDDVWREAAAGLLTGHDVVRGASRLGGTREYLQCLFEVEDSRQRWVLSRRPAMNPAFAIAEVIWILLGSDSAKFINYWNPLLPNYAGHEERYHGAYGHRLRVHFGVDQIARALEALSDKPDSRQIVLQIWDVNRDLPVDGGMPRAADIPCNLISMLKVRDGKLHWTQVMRSNDLCLGTPHNFVQFTSLQEILAGCLGLEIGPYVQLSDSLHVYETDVARFSVAPERAAARNIDRLGVSRAELDQILLVMNRAMSKLSSENLSRRLLARAVRQQDLPRPWENLLCVLEADAARRRGWVEEATAAMDACTNPVLTLSWTEWQKRAGFKTT